MGDVNSDFVPSDIPNDVVIQEALAPYFGGFEEAEDAAHVAYRALVRAYRRTVVDSEELAVQDEELRRLRAEVAHLRAGEAPEPPAPHTELTPTEWLRRFNDATSEKRLEVIAVLQGEADRGSRCFLMDHEGVIETLRAQLSSARNVCARSPLCVPDPTPERITT